MWNEEEKEKLRKVEHRDGYNEGLKRGKEEGKEELLNELVIRNSQIGRSVREIAEILGIDEAHVAQIIELGE